MRWTEKQINFLKEYYYNASKELLKEKLGRSWDAIRMKAVSLDLDRDDGGSKIDAGLDNIEEHIF